MRWDDFRRSDNVEDDRDGGGGFGGGFGRAGGLGIGTVVVLGLIGWALGIDPSVLIGGAEILSGGQQTRYEQPYRPEQRRAGRPTDATGDFVAAVLGDTEDRWTEIFQAGGQHYRAPKLRLFAGSEPTPCAYAQSAMGPFYCPRDERIYLDTSFFRDLQAKFRGCESKACAFAEAYVIAHEVGHHVQNKRSRRRATKQRPIGCRCAWSYRPIASAACGRIRRAPSTISSMPATSMPP